MRLLAVTTLASSLTAIGITSCVHGGLSSESSDQGGAGGGSMLSPGGMSPGGTGVAGAGMSMSGGGTTFGGNPGTAGSNPSSGNGGTSASGGTMNPAGSSGTATAGSVSAGGTSGMSTGKGGGTQSAGAAGKSPGGAGSGNEPHPPPINNGTNAWASRYWDCCKPACGWQGNVQSGSPMTSCNQQNQSLGGDYDARNACEGGGTAYMCWDGVPWSVSDRLSYGFAAASGGNYRCGRCFQLQFTGSGRHGNNPGAQSLNGKTMIVQVINNGGVASDQFDLLIPGGGVGDFNACTAQWGTSDLGAQYGGFLLGCNGDQNCVRQKCQTIFSGKPELMAGCDWFMGWFSAADNPNVVYQQIACPAAITQRSGLRDPG